MPLEFEGVAPPGGKTAHYWAVFGDATNVIAEVGLFNDSVVGTMLLRRALPKSVTRVVSKAYKVDVEVAVRQI